MLPFVFEPGMSFERYVDYALGVPMYFVYRDGRYIDVAGASFRDFLAGKLAQLPGERPTLDDWSDHLTTLFPEVRMKRFLEMRGADGGRWRRICAVPAFWTGLLYDQTVARCGLGSRQGLDGRGAAGAARGRAEDCAARRRSARPRCSSGARRRWPSPRPACSGARLRNAKGADETHLPRAGRGDPARGLTPADEMLARYEREWGRRTDPLFVRIRLLMR